MKKISVVTLMILSLLLVGCDNQETTDGSTETIQRIEALESEKASLILEIEHLENELTLKDEEVFDPYSYSVYQSHYHYMEAVDDTIYVIIRKENPSDSNDWTDVLWSYNPSGSKELCSSKGLDFRVSPIGSYIAITSDQELSIIDPSGTLVKQYSKEDLALDQDLTLSLSQWSDTGDILWLESKVTYSSDAFISINTDTWTYESYTNEYVFTDDYRLNPNTGQIVYSDYPVFFDTISFEEYMKSKSETSLYVYDLNTQLNEVVDTSVTNKYNPKWLDDSIVSYEKSDDINTANVEKIFDPLSITPSEDNVDELWYSLWQELTQDEGEFTNVEIQAINDLLYPVIDNGEVMVVNPLSCFFTSEYDGIEDMDLSAFLRYYPHGEVPNELPEFDQLKSLDKWPFSDVSTLKDMVVPIHRYSSSAINHTLMTFTGLDLKDLKTLDSDDVYYLEDTDAYYNFTSDFGPGYFKCSQGQIKDGNIILFGMSNDGYHRVLRLKKVEDKVVIISYKNE